MGGFKPVGQIRAMNALVFRRDQNAMGVAVELLATHTSGAPVVGLSVRNGIDCAPVLHFSARDFGGVARTSNRFRFEVLVIEVPTGTRGIQAAPDEYGQAG